MFFDQEKHYDKTEIPPSNTKPKYRRLTYDDRIVIENMRKAKKTQSEIAKAIGVSQSTISRIIAQSSWRRLHAWQSVYANVFAIIAQA